MTARAIAAALALAICGCGMQPVEPPGPDASAPPAQTADASLPADADADDQCLALNEFCASPGDSRECCPGLSCKQPRYAPAGDPMRCRY